MRELKFGKIENINPAHNLRSIRQVVLPIIVVNPEGTLYPVGSCFIISSTGKEAIAFTAKHCIEEIMKIDGYRPLYAPSTPPEFRICKYENWEPKNVQMFVGYMTQKGDIIPCRLAKAWFPEKFPDIAVALLRIPEKYEAIFNYRLIIMSRGPKVGDIIHAYGYPNMKSSIELVDGQGVVEMQTLDLPLKHLAAKVETIYSFNEHHFIKWPCFQIDKTFDHGMSGGPVVIEKEGNLIACGIVSSGVSFAEEGMASMIFPGMIIRIDTSFPFLTSNRPSLLDIEKHKMISDISEAHKHVYPNGSWTDSEISSFGLEISTNFSKGDGIIFEFSNFMNYAHQFHWLSEECLHLGKINKHNSDDAEYFLISKDFHQTMRAVEANGFIPNVKFIRADKPYIWIAINNLIYRFFVFVVKLPDDKGTVKILSDAHCESDTITSDRSEK